MLPISSLLQPSFFLWQAENKIIKPLLLLNHITSRFAQKNHFKNKNHQNYFDNPLLKTGDEIQVLSESFHKMVDDINMYVDSISNSIAEKERHNAQMEIAARIQSDMLPSAEKAAALHKDVFLNAGMYAAQEIGGDFYDFFLLDENNIAIIIADVSGKGIPAALYMVTTRTLLRSNLQNCSSLQEALDKTNNQLTENNETAMFVTLFAGILNIAARTLKYINAGHNPPLLISSAEKSVTFLNNISGPILGVVSNINYKVHTLNLNKNDALFLYTDGITEAINAHEELFTAQKLQQELLFFANNNMDDEKIIYFIKQQIELFADETPQADDITMLFVRLP